jgi:flagellar basal-body rod modification protein FlgD
MSAVTSTFFNQPSAMDSTSGATSSSDSSSSQTPSNTLDADSFITLLTTQLQAQDPLNPLDPNQMVDELTSMNTLQQIIQMREDLDAMLGTTQTSGGSASSPNGNTPGAANNSAVNVNASRPAHSFAASTALLNSMNL